MSDCCLLVCLRPATYKRLIHGLYPKGTDGTEKDITAQKTDRLAEYGIQFPRKLPSISTYLSDQIKSDLNQQRYGYVSIGLEAYRCLITQSSSEALLNLLEQDVEEILTLTIQHHDLFIVHCSLKTLLTYLKFYDHSQSNASFSL